MGSATLSIDIRNRLRKGLISAQVWRRGVVGELERIKIGQWTATPALNLLERETRSIKIEPRAMDVLVVLAKHDGAVVRVDELIASAWKGVVVGDGSVYLAIRQLRQVLDDPDGGTSHIENIARRGYRLTVPVERVETSAATAEPREPTSERSTVGRKPWAWLATVAVGAVLLIGLAVALRDNARSTAGRSVAVLPFENLSSDPE